MRYLKKIFQYERNKRDTYSVRHSDGRDGFYSTYISIREREKNSRSGIRN